MADPANRAKKGPASSVPLLIGPSSRAMTISELSEYLRVPEETLYRRARETGAGRLPAFKVSGAWRLRLGDVLDWLLESW